MKELKKSYQSIQILRGILFIIILSFHCGVPFSNMGWAGVEFFFVLSSFFLVNKFCNNTEIDLKKQFIHRIMRLYPPYLIVVFIAIIYALHKKVIPYDLVTHFFSLQNFQWMITNYVSPMQLITAHTWTLSIEVWAGLILLILIKIVPKKRIKLVLLGMILIGTLYRNLVIIFHANIWTVSLCPVAHFDAFACGALLANGINEKKYKIKHGIISCILGLGGIISCIFYLSIKNSIYFMQGYKLFSSSKNYLDNCLTGNIYFFIALLATGFIGLLLLMGENKKKSNKDIILKKFFLFIGNVSYVLYLFHWPILIVIKRFFKNWFILLPVVFVITIFVTIVFNKSYEFMKNKHLGGK